MKHSNVKGPHKTKTIQPWVFYVIAPILLLTVLIVVVLMFRPSPVKTDEGYVDMAKVFEGIYGSTGWGSDGDGSGSGSSESFTKNFRSTLLAICNIHHIRSMIDVPCGACVWTAQFLAESPLPLKYVGLDVSETALQTAEVNISGLPPDRKSATQLLKADVSRDPLPTGPFDLLLCRDTLQHLSLQSCYSLLRNLSNTNAKYYLIGSYVTGQNVDIREGEYFSIDLTQAPFNMRPSKIFCENHPDTEPQKHLYFYPRDQFVEYVSRLPY